MRNLLLLALLLFGCTEVEHLTYYTCTACSGAVCATYADHDGALSDDQAYTTEAARNDLCTKLHGTEGPALIACIGTRFPTTCTSRRVEHRRSLFNAH